MSTRTTGSNVVPDTADIAIILLVHCIIVQAVLTGSSLLLIPFCGYVMLATFATLVWYPGLDNMDNNVGKTLLAIVWAYLTGFTFIFAYAARHPKPAKHTTSAV